VSAFAHCQGTKANGDPCLTRLGLSEDGYCLAHDAKRADEMRAIRAEGGRKAGEARRAAREAREAMRPFKAPKAPTTLDEIVRYSAWALDEHAAGRLNEKDVKAIAAMMREQRMTLKERDGLHDEIRELRETVRALRERLQGAGK
jgi:hypothetical protein